MVRFCRCVILSLLFCIYYTVGAQQTFYATVVDSTTIQLYLNSYLIDYVDSNNVEAVKYLLLKGADPNTRTQEGVTPLMFASQNGNYAIAKLLLESGANANSRPWDGNTALHAAVRSNCDSIAELLLVNGAEVNARNTSGIRPIHYAAGLGYPYLTDLLLYYGSDIDSVDNNGNTPLMASVYAGAQSVTSLLIGNGADVNRPDNRGVTPLMVAAQFNDTAITRMLIDAGAEICPKNRRGIDACGMAIVNRSEEVLAVLLGHGTLCDSTKNSYYQLAIEYGDERIKAMLRGYGVKPAYRLSISQFSLGSGCIASRSDFALDFGVGLFESLSKISFDLSFRFRPRAVRVLTYRDDAIYQFWEKRKSLNLSINKYLELGLSNSRRQVGFVFGVAGELAWRDYRGTDMDPRTAFYLVPAAGAFYRTTYCTFIGRLERTNYGIPEFSNTRFGLYMTINIPTSATIGTINKKIHWLD